MIAEWQNRSSPVGYADPKMQSATSPTATGQFTTTAYLTSEVI